MTVLEQGGSGRQALRMDTDLYGGHTTGPGLKLRIKAIVGTLTIHLSVVLTMVLSSTTSSSEKWEGSAKLSQIQCSLQTSVWRLDKSVGLLGSGDGRPQGGLENKAIAHIAAEHSRCTHLDPFLLGDFPTQWYELLLHMAQ